MKTPAKPHTSAKPHKSKRRLPTAQSLIRIAVLLVLAGIVCAGLLLYRDEAVRTTVQDYLTARKIDKVIVDYTDNVVVRTLADVADKIAALRDATVRLQAEPSEAAMRAATDAWRAARAQWQAIYTFAYGPNAFYDFDKQIASWPLDRPMIDHTIAEMAAGRLQLTSRYLREQQYSTLRGFFAAEYLLFRDGQPRRAGDLGPFELQYLTAVTRAMAEESLDFQAAWVGTDRLPAPAVAALTEAGLRPRTSYAEEFKHPGQPGSRYVSPSIPLQEMFQESHSVVEDACAMIEEMLASDDPKDSESRYSRNVSADIVNRLKGVETAYLGGIEGVRRHAQADLVANKNSVLDRRIRISLARAQHSVAAVGDPYGEHREDKELKVRRAMAACTKLADNFASAIPVVCLDPASKPWAAYGR